MAALCSSGKAHCHQRRKTRNSQKRTKTRQIRYLLNKLSRSQPLLIQFNEIQMEIYCDRRSP